MRYEMPRLDIDSLDLTDDERDLAQQSIRPDGHLYGSKPREATGEAKYLWRMLVWGLSPNPRHQCLPVMAEFDLEGDYEEVRVRAGQLDALAQRIERQVPVQERHGTLAWGRAFGML